MISSADGGTRSITVTVSGSASFFGAVFFSISGVGADTLTAALSRPAGVRSAFKLSAYARADTAITAAMRNIASFLIKSASF